MKKQRTRALVALGVFGLLGVAGCELAVDFDRTKIDSGTFDASIGETSTFDAPVAMDAQGDGIAPGDGATPDGSDASVSDADASTAFDADDGFDGADE
ncbi:MAG: hypothetical protein ABIP39_05575 [Polyangiaceae bacterium]